ncbi:hypothetical protein QYM36_009987 [Artemia franciscana]|uniref:Uncharacterized protein n=1 Tax=Artemia franciscana TaxID=6661 RepID=A0AA88LBD3_ARTSF|nr:hypothetical protein QYM36_009987 [Artemia franciscana]
MYSDTAVQDTLENMATFPMGQFSTLSNLEISDSQFLLLQLNIQLVSAHFEDLQKITGFDKSSIILLQETFDTLSDHIWMESYTVWAEKEYAINRQRALDSFPKTWSPIGFDWLKRAKEGAQGKPDRLFKSPLVLTD